ncbi:MULTISPECIES: sugar-binding transcriptional regulator [Rhizobium/Agrobacterium group]|mgnify:FL=1|uniref:LacI family transcriptional regulator n=1 Tax=Rhizobium rhizogenes TaxID=359 RepID=A0AA92C792_RHIRH|nr:sugar-binding transcriptional regulator [Rhizobium rhizogenes]MDP9573044.1 DNA-binding transcriptional regulator LsrR (DeoR family) [Agrobacterium larrymoorei]MQB21127.1 sugar-binding transcriptional regulator [Agrobacterium tumefaciens]PVE77939.1 LacI family transcriptional regulator [Sphingomonas sp. TPD3009]PVE57294.1 LacI family transcriptional regulator [Rhizobium rhizogenes]PVE68191.1 LacI family transcriptional regulator [Agrobacterium tumefaciens]
MAKLRRETHTAFSEAPSLRLRAAWLYYNQGMTQKDVAEKLGISRSTVIRLLDEAMKRSDVQIWINEGIEDFVALSIDLEKAYGLDEAVIIPTGSDKVGDIAKGVGLALGQFLSEVVPDNATIGVGWGRTMTASLSSFRPPRRENCKVVSLLGGIVAVHQTNPLDYTWRLASALGAECYMFLAPLLVDSIETKRALIEKCGLSTLYALAENLDLAIVSCGDIGPHSTSLSEGFISKQTLDELVAAGCVCDTMFNFIDAEGRSVDHPINNHAMSIDLDTLKKAKHIVLASGGAHRATAIRATIKRIGCNTLITDEAAARALMELAAAGKATEAE